MQPTAWNRPPSGKRPPTRDPFAPRTTNPSPSDPFAPRTAQQNFADPFAPQSSQPQTGDPFASRSAPSRTSDPFASRSSPYRPRSNLFPSKVPRNPYTQQTAPGFSSFGGAPSTFGAAPSTFGGPSSRYESHEKGFGAAQPSGFGNAPETFSKGRIFERAAPPRPFASSNQNNSFDNTNYRPDPFNSQSSQASSSNSAPADPFASQSNWKGGRSGQSRNFTGPSTSAPQDPFARNTSRHDGGSQHDRPRGLSTQILIKGVPLSLFSRQALQEHFEQFPDVKPVSVSLRGSLERDGRRTALVSFNTPQETSIAMSRARMHEGVPLVMSYFRAPERMQGVEMQRNSQPPPTENVQMSNELLFSFVPPDLFSEEAIRHLFNSISGNKVVYVSIRSRRFRGTVKRTAIVEFVDVQSAKSALENLPLYKGQVLQVSYRSRPPHLQRRNNEDASASALPADSMSMVDADDTAGMDDVVATDYAPSGQTEWDQGYQETNQDDLHAKHTAEDLDQASYEPEVRRKSNARSSEMSQTEREIEMARLRLRISEKEKAKKAQAARQKSRRQTSDEPDDEQPPKATHSAPKRPQRQSKASSKEGNRDDGGGEGAWRNVGKKVDIRDAVQFVGTCQTMCPKKEFSDRVLQKDMSLFETVDNLGKDPDPAKAVKKYRRSAAISEQPTPEEIRPPPVLLKTMNHLRGICDLQGFAFTEIHSFVRDRTRSLRQDFTFQGVRDETCIKIHEECVRFHILSEHRLAGTDPALFSSKQNREQLDKCLISLREMYDLRREQELPTAANEPEMQAYYLLTQMSKPKTCVQIFTGFAPDVRRSTHVQFALEVVKAAADSFGNHVGYFAYVRAAPYLIACLMHSHFVRLRCNALNLINSSHGNPTGPDVIEIPTITRQLGFADDAEAENFCAHLGMDVIEVNSGRMGASSRMLSVPSDGFDVSSGDSWPSAGPEPAIEDKVKSFSPSQIISGSGRDSFNLGELPYSRSPYLPRGLSSKRRPAKALQRSPTQKTHPAVEARKAAQKQAGYEKHSVPQQNADAPVVSQPQAPTAPSTSFELQEPPASVAGTVAGKTFTPLKPRVTSPAASHAHRVGGGSGSLAPTWQMTSFQRSPPKNQPERNVLTINQVQVQKSVADPVEASVDRAPSQSFPGAGHGKQKVVMETSSLPVGMSVGQANSQSMHRARSHLESSSGRKAAEKRRQEQLARARAQAEAAQAERHRQEQIILAEAEMEQARAELEAHREFMGLAIKIFERVDELNAMLDGVKNKFQRLAIEIDGSLAVLEACKAADSVFKLVADDLNAQRKKLSAIEPPTPNGKAAKEELFRKLSDTETQGEKLWRAVWVTRGLAITAPEVMQKPRSVPLSNFRAAVSHSGSKRKASMDNEYIVDSRKKKQRDLSGESRSKTEIPSPVRTTPTASEAEIIQNAMKRADLIRWQCAIIEPSDGRGADEELLYCWAKKRFSRGTEVSGNVVCNKSASDDKNFCYMSVRDAKVGGLVPHTANALIFCADISSGNGYARSIRDLLILLRKLKAVRISTSSLPPSLIFVHTRRNRADSDGDEIPNETTLQKHLTEIVGQGLLVSFHVVEISTTCARYESTTRPFLSALSATVSKTAESMRKDGNEWKFTTLGDLLLRTGNAAWIKYADVVERNRSSYSYEQVIDVVNKAWMNTAKLLETEQESWPAEMSEFRSILEEAKTAVLQKARLPHPTQLNAHNEDEYIACLAKHCGVVLPATQGNAMLPYAKFCLALEKIMVTFLSKGLGDDYGRRLHLREKLVAAAVTAPSYRIRRRLDRASRVQPTSAEYVERAWDGTPLGSSKKTYSGSNPFLRTSGAPGKSPSRLPTGMSPKVEQGQYVQNRRKSLGLLPRAIEFSPQPRRKRLSLPIDKEKAQEMYRWYDNLVKVEEAHQALMDETLALLQEEIALARGQKLTV